MSIKDVFVFASPAPKPWCARCDRNVKPRDFSQHTYLCLECEAGMLERIRQWAAGRAHEVAQGVVRRRTGPDPLPELSRR